jgi:hypothetical protein
MVVEGHLGAEGPREERLRRIIAPSVLLVLSSILVVVGGLISLSDRSTGSSAAGDVSGMIVFGGPQLLLAVALAVARRRRPRQVWSILALVLGAVSLVLAASASRTASGSGDDTLILLVILASILWIVAGLTALVSTRSRSGDSPAR